jgi:hypothetical protein
MFALDFARITMWFVPSSDPLLRELVEAATGGADAHDLDHALMTSSSPAEGGADGETGSLVDGRRARRALVLEAAR